MSRPSEYTRNSIMKAAVALFAERGYDGTSIRAIVSKARVNQAAINYHFKGKEGLYAEVLKVAFEGYLRLDNFDPERLWTCRARKPCAASCINSYVRFLPAIIR